MVLKLSSSQAMASVWFENDVKMYGTQASMLRSTGALLFENDVKMYGTQATVSE